MSEAVTRLTAALADRYLIERELGAGGMATVYLAEDLKHKRQVAVKVLKPELAAVLGGERFVHEITTTASLQHPHILPLFDSGTADRFLYYVMPYVEGETLRDKLNRETQLGIDEAVKIATEVADALDYAHRHGVIHRDIKPENILLHDGRPMVVDFGIALAVSAAAGGRMTETGLSLGTPHYMSPEQATAEKDLTNRSDIYSLGAVLYEMLTGDPPHTASSAQQIIMKIVTEEAQPVTRLRKSVPPHVAAAVGKGLEKLPADRFARAADFGAALGGATTMVTWPGTGAGPVAPHASWLAALVPWMVAGVAAVVAVTAWVSRGPQPDLRPLRAELEPPPGTEYSEFRFAALSPDGRRLALVGLDATGGRQLWIRDLMTGRADSFPATRGAEAPFWSPSGRALGYFAGGALWRLELDGGTPRELCAPADVGGSWSRDDLILLTRGGHPMTVRADGGACEAVLGAWSDSARIVRFPAWLPDGRHFVWLDMLGENILRSSVDGEEPQPFIEAAGDIQIVEPDIAVFARNGRTGVDVVAQRFDRRMTLVGAPVTLAEGVRSAGSPASYTVTGTSLAYLPTAQVDLGPLLVDRHGSVVDSVVHQGTWTLRHARDRPVVALAGFGLWLYDLLRHTSVAVKASGFYMFPVWGPGDSLLAVTNLATCQVLLMRLADRADTTLIDQPGLGCAFPTDWTANGRFLLLNRFGATGRGEVWTYAIETGEQERLLSVEGSVSAGVLSPDLRWLAYVSDETGELQVYARPFRRPGAPVRVSTGGGALPRWRHDGRALFYQAPDGAIMRVGLAGGPTLKLGTAEALFRAPRWSPRLFADQSGGVQKTTPYDVTPDGERFLIRQRSEGTSAAVLLLNWRSLLKRGTGDGSP
jgi:serine/threonine-protein kinase